MKFILYCACGGAGVLADCSVFYLLVSAGVWYQAANILSYMTGTLISFALNRVITFKTPDRMWSRLLMFLTVAACGYLCSAFLLWILVDHFAVGAKIAKLSTLPVVVALQYTLNNRFSFRQLESHP